MQTLFECWNGGHAGIHDNRPWFSFLYPGSNQELLTFFQLSGRIWETLAGVDCYLNLAGQVYDVPNYPVQEVNLLVSNIQQKMGYTPYVVPYMAATDYGSPLMIQVVIWVNMGTGRADSYSPTTGYVYGQQLMMPQQQYSSNFYSQFAMMMQANGNVTGTGQKNTLEMIAGIVSDVNDIFGHTSNMMDHFQHYYDNSGGAYGGGWQ